MEHVTIILERRDMRDTQETSQSQAITHQSLGICYLLYHGCDYRLCDAVDIKHIKLYMTFEDIELSVFSTGQLLSLLVLLKAAVQS